MTERAMAKVFVVDDEADMRWLLAGVLRDQGFEVITAEDGRAALAHIAREAPDVLLLDLRMPGLDGIQVLEQVRGVDPHLPVVIVTAYGDLPSAIQAMRLGAYDYLTKPFDHDELLFTVRRALEKRELEAARVRVAKVATLLEAARALRHEINNPLTAILAHAQLLERELTDTRAAARVRVILESSERIARVIERLSAIVEPVVTFQQGVGPMLDLASSRTAGEEAPGHGTDLSGG